MVETRVSLPGLELKNPLMPASGTFGFCDTKIAKSFDLNQLGALVLKTATLEKRTGNPQPQIKLLKDGVMNSVGLTNPGANAVVQQKIPALVKKYPALPIIASVGGKTLAEYIEVAQILASSKNIRALEINLSCPNVQEGGMHFGSQSETVEKITQAIKDKVELPIYVKLTPNVTNIVTMAQAAQAGGADGLSVINTLLGLDIDIYQRKSVLGGGLGGLSGSAVQAVALRMVYQIHQHCKLPIIGMGGISTAEDVVKFFLAGASAVAVGSAHFKDPKIIPHLAEQLPILLEKLGINDLNELQGQLSI